ncbi:MAG: hypothetical protein RMI89_10890 [Gloeomargarita sp. SKYBB_i_bin120]|nr:hypothetical protein [Gloeomargarita sp. SKYG98]MCS7293456.1 hypothetical protein [Gloeomargarita sp. SKYB120]MDW8179022.1 hypothetical protein [Gloeomargarita sp. SKYBB_i_bin120]
MSDFYCAGMTITAYELPSGLYEQLSQLLQQECRLGEAASGPPFVRDIKLFQKPGYRGLDWDFIKVRHLRDLFTWVKSIYPEVLAYIQLDDYWDELDIFRNAQTQSPDEFWAFLRGLFLAEAYSNSRHVSDQDALLNELRRVLQTDLGDAAYPISIYCLTDAENENTAFAPYVSVGHRCMIVTLRQWVL